MPIAVTTAPYRPVPLDPPRKRWTREDCEALEASGLLDQDRLELTDGELISKMGKKRAHVNAATIVAAWLIRTFGEQYVNQEAPIDVAPEDNPANEPEPDLIDMIHTHPFLADGGSEIQFNVIFPRAHTYRVWVQFQRSGVVNTAYFDVPVKELE